jgi:hypothetical protein
MGIPKSERGGFRSRSGRLFIELDEQVSGHHMITAETHAPKYICCPNQVPQENLAVSSISRETTSSGAQMAAHSFERLLSACQS